MMKSFVFAAAVVCAIAYGSVDAAARDTRQVLTGSCGPNLTYRLDTDTHILTISGTGNMTNYASRANVTWYSNRLNIEHVVINEGVTSIGSYAFQYCEKMVDISLPKTLISIGRSSINNCYKLASISLPPNLKEIKLDAFFGAKSLTSVVIPPSVTSIEGGVFGNCSNLKSIEVNKSNSRYKSIDGVLYDNTNNIIVQYPPKKAGTHYTIPYSVKTIGRYAFSNCTLLESVLIPSKVTSIDAGAFSGCSGLTSVVIPASVKSIGSIAFEYCTKLETVSYLGVNVSSYTNVFRGSGLLTTICVSADYGNNTFSGKTVTCNASYTSEDLANVPSPCIEVSCDGDDFYVAETDESIEWEDLSTGCVEHQCVNEGFAQWAVCNDTEDIEFLCTEDACICRNNISYNHTWEVDIKFEKVCDYVDLMELATYMEELGSVNASNLTIAGDVTGQGCFVEIVVYLNDEDIARKLGDAIDALQPDNCKYGVLCQKKGVEVRLVPLVEEASLHYISIFAILMSFVLVMVN